MFDFPTVDVLLREVAGPLSGALSVFAFIPYIRDTLRGETKPQRASWLIWSVLGSIAFASQAAEGLSASLWFAGVQVSGTLAVFLLSITHGVGGFISRRDVLVLCAAAMGLAVWFVTKDAGYALAITIALSLLGGVVTIMKAYESPESETLTSWAASFIASGFAILSISEMSWVLLAYPLYLLTLNGGIILAIALGRTERMVRARSYGTLSY